MQFLLLSSNFLLSFEPIDEDKKSHLYLLIQSFSSIDASKSLSISSLQISVVVSISTPLGCISGSKDSKDVRSSSIRLLFLFLLFFESSVTCSSSEFFSACMLASSFTSSFSSSSKVANSGIIFSLVDVLSEGRERQSCSSSIIPS